MDAFFKSNTFKDIIKKADEYALQNDLDTWATRISWLCLAVNVKTARRWASKNNKKSPAWAAYHNLLQAEVVSENPDGIFYSENPRWESDEGTMRWFNTIVQIAENGPNAVPHDFPTGP